MASKKVPQTAIHKLNTSPFENWPAPVSQLEAARTFLKETAQGKHLTVISADKDADGLSAGLVIHKTLRLLGMPEELLHVHLLTKGQGLFGDVER